MIRKILIEIGKGTWVGGKLVVLLTKTVTGGNLTEANEVDDIKGARKYNGEGGLFSPKLFVIR